MGAAGNFFRNPGIPSEQRRLVRFRRAGNGLASSDANPKQGGCGLVVTFVRNTVVKVEVFSWLVDSQGIVGVCAA